MKFLFTDFFYSGTYTNLSSPTLIFIDRVRYKHFDLYLAGLSAQLVCNLLTVFISCVHAESVRRHGGVENQTPRESSLRTIRTYTYLHISAGMKRQQQQPTRFEAYNLPMCISTSNKSAVVRIALREKERRMNV